MIVVTGTMRSGTSMWMQAMQAGGLQTVGAAFPEPWGERLREANPRGFYESKLLSGIYFGTNPDPATGAYLHPARSRRLVAKVFVPGLIRTDIAFLDRVLATVRPWREYAASIARMKAMDGDGLRQVPGLPVSAAMEWFLENFSLIRDIALRGYPAHITTYDRVVRNPRTEVREVMRWIGLGDWKKAQRSIDPSLRTQREGGSVALPDDLDASEIELLDELYEALNQAGSLSPALVSRLNDLEQALRPRVVAARGAARDVYREILLEAEVTPSPEPLET